MIIKFNNGNGAVLCEHCKVIIMSHFTSYEWAAFSALEEKGVEWFCEECQPNSAKEQVLQLIDTINQLDVEKLNKKYRSQYPKFSDRDGTGQVS